MMADVLVHEVYEAESGSSQGTSFVPTSVELDNYTKLLNNPGEVQPHGCFFLVDEANGPLQIIAASSNTDEIFGVHHSACIGKPLGDLIQGGGAPLISALSQTDLSFANPVSVQAVSPPPPPAQNAFNFILHRSPSGILVDVEPYDRMENSFAFHQRVRFAIERLNNTPTMAALYPQVADEIFSTTGYNRVMVYKFHEDMHGEVVAECKKADEEPEWMGLHFPATDVPQRTRDQLRRELVRMIGDAKGSHVPIVTDGSMDAESIDLMGSTLRSAHHCHLQYLQNMGTRASLAFAVVVKEALWGLVVCHSAVPKTVSFQLRMAGEFLVQALAMRLSNLMDLENHTIQDRILKTHAKLCDFMYQQGHNPGLRVKGLLNNKPNLLDLLPGVDGAVVQFAGKIQAIGRAPDQLTLQKFCTWIHHGWQEEGGRVIRCYNTIKNLPEHLMAELQGQWGGMLITPLGLDGLMMFWRPQLSQSMRWGGNPNEAARRKGEVMHPRGSFEIFTDSVKDQCQPWLKWEMEAVSGLCALVKDILESADADEVRSNVLVRLNQERMQYHSDKEAVVSEMTALMESVKAPVMAVDQWGMILQWNSMMEDLTKHSKDSVIGRPLDNFVTEAHRHVLKNLIRDAIARVDATNVELSILKANSAALPVGQRRVDLKVSTSGRFTPSGACTSVVFVGHAAHTSKGKEGELEEQLEAVVQMTAPSASAFAEDSEGNYEWYPDKDSSLLGEGSFGKTHKMKGKIDGQLYAVKMINVKKAEKNGVQLAALKKEVQMLMMLNSPHVIRYFTCYMFKKDKFFCIVMELVEGGTLGDLIEDTRGTVNRIQPDRVLMLTIQITKALAHIHSKKMLHRDIKPHNILLSEDGSESKVTDFGFACVMSSAAAASRAGTLTYSSPEKAGAKGYNSKDDMWALGCIISELVTGTSMTARCGGGIFAFNMPLIARTIEQVRSINEHMGKHVAALLSIDPAKRPSPTELLAALEPGPTPGVQADDAEELCEEYMCAICQNLVLDATTVCNDEHVFCSSCLQVWLDTKNECPTCRKPALDPHRLRIINNAVEKLATRLLSATALTERNERKAQRVADQEEKRRKAAEQEQREEEARRAEDARIRRQSGEEQEEEEGEQQGVSAFWKYAQAEVHYGAGCTLLRHSASGSVVEVFHSNGWYRFRVQPGEGTRWCNSCGNIGESEFGAQDVVQQLDGGGGQDVPAVGLGMLDDSAYWECRVSGNYLVLCNSDDEEMYLDRSGGFIWLSHPGMNKAVIAREGSVNTGTRTEAEGLLRL